MRQIVDEIVATSEISEGDNAKTRSAYFSRLEKEFGLRSRKESSSSSRTTIRDDSSQRVLQVGMDEESVTPTRKSPLYRWRSSGKLTSEVDSLRSESLDLLSVHSGLSFQHKRSRTVLEVEMSAADAVNYDDLMTVTTESEFKERAKENEAKVINESFSILAFWIQV